MNTTMNFKKYITVLLTVLLIAGCTEEMIEITPEDRVTPDIALKRVSGINALVLSAYKRINEFGYYGQSQILNAEALADNLVIANNTGRYTGQVVNQVASHFTTWSAAPYRIINDANLVLKYADASQPALETSGLLAGLPQSEALTAPRRLRYKGEALFLRALALHDLAKVYGYEPGREVGNWNLGAIIRTTAVEGVAGADKRTRSTNEQCYQQIEADLLAAIGLLPPLADFIGSTTDPTKQWASGERYWRVSKEGAKLLLARVYLFWGKNTQANQYATEAITEITGFGKNLVTAANYFNSWSTALHPESIFESEIRVVDWSTVDGVNNSLASVTNSSPSGASNAQFAVQGSAELMAAFETDDVRRNQWVNNSGRNECKKWQGEKGNFLENIPILRLSEAYLIAAEARANLNDDPGAQTAINTLRTNRGLAATAATGNTLKDLIQNERRVELCFEGHRFFDLKRLGKDIIKPASLLINNIPYTDFRILGNIPTAEVTYNTSLQQNPNY
jgi:starch-binding outer membrane protein, SusD/RagB family